MDSTPENDQEPLLQDDESESQEDLESNSSEQPICRICFGSDDQETMFTPCRCAGSNLYVHRQCLNEWRVSADNQEAFTKCFTCNYKYKIETEYTTDGCCRRSSMSLAQNFGCLFLLNLVIMFLGGSIVRKIDSGRYIATFFGEYVDHKIHRKQENDYFYYYVFVGYLMLSLAILACLINLIRARNRQLYLNYLLGHNRLCGVVRISVVVFLTIYSFFTNVFIAGFILTCEIQTLIFSYHRYQDEMARACEHRVLPYNPAEDQQQQAPQSAS